MVYTVNYNTRLLFVLSTGHSNLLL